MRDQPQDATIAVRPLCEAIGISWQGQHAKLRTDTRFSYQDILTTGTDGKQYEMGAIPINKIGGFLFSINSNKVKPEVRQTLIEFQEFCQMELWAAINGKAETERVTHLESRVHLLEGMNRQLLGAIQALTEEVRLLKNPVEYILNREASAAGSRLAAQKQVNKYLQ